MPPTRKRANDDASRLRVPIFQQAQATVIVKGLPRERPSGRFDFCGGTGLRSGRAR